MKTRNLAVSLLLASGWAFPGTATAEGMVTGMSVTPTLAEPYEKVTLKAFGTVPEGKKCAVVFVTSSSDPNLDSPHDHNTSLGHLGSVQSPPETEFVFKEIGVYEVKVWGATKGVHSCQTKAENGKFVQKVLVVADKDQFDHRDHWKPDKKYHPRPEPGPPPVKRIQPGRAPVETIQPGHSPAEKTAPKIQLD